MKLKELQLELIKNTIKEWSNLPWEELGRMYISKDIRIEKTFIRYLVKRNEDTLKISDLKFDVDTAITIDRQEIYFEITSSSDKLGLYFICRSKKH